MNRENTSSPQIVTMGETMVTLVSAPGVRLRDASEFTRQLAGAESNVAIGLARLGVRAGWVSRVGDDEFGEYIRSAVEAEGVDVTWVERDPNRPTGIMFKELQAGSGRRVLYYRSGSAASAMSAETLPIAYLRRAPLLHLTGVTPALSASAHEAASRATETVHESFGSVSFDVNLRPRLGVPDPLALFKPFMHLARYLFVGLDEAEQLFGTSSSISIKRSLVGLSPGTIVLKRGAEGAEAYYMGDWISEPGFNVDAIDEVGAGDAFAAAFLAATLRGDDVPEALRVANAAGAIVTTVIGDCEGLPTWYQIDRLLRA